MYFSGDPSARRRVDLGGRSYKERDRQILVEQTRLERQRRQRVRLEIASALRIQKWFRGRKVAQAAKNNLREDFCARFGDHCQAMDASCFSADSDFLGKLIFFFNANNEKDIIILMEVCNALLQYVKHSGDVVGLLSGVDYSLTKSQVEHRVNKVVYLCLQALYTKRNQWKDQFFMSSMDLTMPAVVLLEAVSCLLDPQHPWACNIICTLQQKNVYFFIRSIIVSGVDLTSIKLLLVRCPLEQVLSFLAAHTGQHQCHCTIIDPRQSFPTQILTIPFVWRCFPNFKEGLFKYYIHQIASFLPSYVEALPSNLSATHPSYACLLGNLLEAANFPVPGSKLSVDTAIHIATVSTVLLDDLPTVRLQHGESEDEMSTDERIVSVSRDLERQISAAVDSRLLQHLVNSTFEGTLSNPSEKGTSDKEAEAVGSICAFLHVTFSTFPLEWIMTGLAYRTEIVPALGMFIKKCHDNRNWPNFTNLIAHVPGDSSGWLICLVVFCPVYKHMLAIMDSDEFCKQKKPHTLEDLRSLIIILKQALWQILWTTPSQSSSAQKTLTNLSDLKKLSFDNIKSRAKVVISELLIQLQDWNNRLSFAAASDFYFQEAINENFVSQASLGTARASEILKLAPFLIPFTARVKIFSSQLATFRQTHGSHSRFGSHRFSIRRDHIVEDAFRHLNNLSEEELQGQIRVSIVNEMGLEEAGIDGGGIFKDFMENIIRAAFDIQYGLFKETTDHLLYPNPGSRLIFQEDLQYFHLLGTLLGKAMYEGILVDLPFARFFLSKLKQKHNYLNDLPSLDPELYRQLLFLKHYNGDIANLELYFVIVSNEYGEQLEEELVPGGRTMRVTNENLIMFIHLVAHHRLNNQIRLQSEHFLRGFQRLIQKEWMDMFDEHELQLLISGSLESLDFDDLRSNTNYSGGYGPDHPVIERFWAVLKSFSLEHQKKFLKFVTGCSRGPLLGFKYLEPKLCIQRASASDDEEVTYRLPTSATCINLLKLPPYATAEQLQSKLLYAITAEAGFELS